MVEIWIFQFFDQKTVFRPSSIQLNSRWWIRALGIRANEGDPVKIPLKTFLIPLNEK